MPRRTNKRGKSKGRPVVAAAFLVFMIALAAVLFFRGYFGVERLPLQAPPPEAPLYEAPPRKITPSFAKIAIVIDDMGGDERKLEEILDLAFPVTVAVLPYLKDSQTVAREAHKRGLEVLLHLPMEPMDTLRNNPGQGAIKVDMSAADIRAKLKADIAALPHIDGVNNHMGSRFTENERLMRDVLEVLKERGLFFLDSRTSPHSVAGMVARDYGVRTAQRNVFLDNRRDREYIKGQWRELIAIAKKRGKAIAIGHPYRETLEVLKEVMDDIEKEGVTAVRVSELAG